MSQPVQVRGRIARSAHDVYEAVVDPEQLSAYFTTGGARGRMESGATVSWEFADFPGRFPVTIVEVVPDQKVVFRWQASDRSGESYETTVTMEFDQLDDGRTLVTITEEGWRDGEDGVHAALGNTEGWTGMLCALKCWIEHGFNLREGFYK